MNLVRGLVLQDELRFWRFQFHFNTKCKIYTFSDILCKRFGVRFGSVSEDEPRFVVSVFLKVQEVRDLVFSDSFQVYNWCFEVQNFPDFTFFAFIDHCVLYFFIHEWYMYLPYYSLLDWSSFINDSIECTHD